MRFQRNKTFFVFLVFASVILSCSESSITRKKDEVASDFSLEIPLGFPAMDFPADNKLTGSRVELGEKLFFDKLLSRDSSVSCATCHIPSRAFADTVAISPGINGKMGFRNAPSILNAGYFSSFMLDGGVPTLEIQVVHPLTDTNEMGFGINEVVDRLKNDKNYSELAAKAYSREIDPYVITRALSAYERTLVSGNSAFDEFKFQEKENALTESEKRGMDLFFSEELQCSSCHSGFLFTNGKFENNGSKSDYTGDNGRERITHKAEDIGKFKVPSLRNLKLTAPYMHDGSFASLKDVVLNYAKGGSNHPNKNPLIKPLQLDETEITDLIHFLESLSE